MRRAAIPLLLVLALLLSACGASSSGEAGEELDIPDYSKLDAASVSVVTPDEAGLEIGNMPDALPIGGQYIGYNEDEMALVYLYGDEVRQISLDGTNDISLLSLGLNPESDGLIEAFYEDGWVIWVQYSLDDMAATWVLSAQNTAEPETGGAENAKLTVEAATDYSEPGSVSAPAHIAYADGRISYSGVAETESGLVRAIKLYDLNEGTMELIAQTPLDSGVTYTYPAMGTEYVAYAAHTEDEGYIICGYIIPIGETYEVSDSAQIASVYASGFYLAAVIDESVAVYDPFERTWRDVYNSASDIDLAGASSAVWQLDISQVAVSGANMLLGGTSSLYLLNLDSLEAVELVPAGDETVTSVQIDGTLAIWRTFNRDTGEASYNYANVLSEAA